MKSFYFTFGLNHKHGDRYQEIKAIDQLAAQKKMFEVHGKEWGIPYTPEEWHKYTKQGWFKNLKPLKPLKVEVEIK